MPATLSKEDEGNEQERVRKEKIIRALSLNMFLGVTVLCLPIQADLELFNNILFPGDAAKAAAALTATSSMAGAAEFLFNPTLGRLSDRVGRRQFFIFSPAIASLSVALLALKGTSSVPLAYLCSALRKVMSTWGGSVATMTLLGDLMSGQEYSIAFARIFGSAGWGVIVGPLLGSILYRRTGSVRAVYAASAVLAALQTLNNNLMIPETLTPANAKAFMGLVNPFSFVKLFTYDASMTKMVLAAVCPSFGEGKNINDITMVWATNELKLPSNTIGTYITAWGMCCLLNGMLITPKGIKVLGMRGFTTLTNTTNAIYYLVTSQLAGFSDPTLPLYIGLALLTLGINGTNGAAPKGWATQYALRNGMGSGEYAGYFSNARALTTVFSPLIYGNMYQALKRRGANPAPVWFVALLLASLSTELLWRSIPNADMPDAPQTQKRDDNKAKA